MAGLEDVLLSLINYPYDFVRTDGLIELGMTTTMVSQLEEDHCMIKRVNGNVWYLSASVLNYAIRTGLIGENGPIGWEDIPAASRNLDPVLLRGAGVTVQKKYKTILLEQLDKYARSIPVQTYETMSTPQLLTLLKKEKDLHARDTLGERYFPLVLHVCKAYQKKNNHIPWMTLVAYGTGGLYRAFHKYNSDMNISKTYLKQHIRGEILDRIRADDRLPRQLRDLQKIINNRPVTSELIHDISIELDKPLALIQQRADAILVVDTVPLQIVTGKERTYETERITPPQTSSFENDLLTSFDIQYAMETLSKREREIISGHYLYGIPLKNFGLSQHVSDSRIGQIHNRALAKLRKALGTYHFD